MKKVNKGIEDYGAMKPRWLEKKELRNNLLKDYEFSKNSNFFTLS